MLSCLRFLTAVWFLTVCQQNVKCLVHSCSAFSCPSFLITKLVQIQARKLCLPHFFTVSITIAAVSAFPTVVNCNFGLQKCLGPAPSLLLNIPELALGLYHWFLCISSAEPERQCLILKTEQLMLSYLSNS